MEGSMNLYDLIEKPEHQLDWVKELYPHLTLIDKDNPRTTQEIIDEMEDKCPSECFNQSTKHATGCTIN